MIQLTKNIFASESILDKKLIGYVIENDISFNPEKYIESERITTTSENQFGVMLVKTTIQWIWASYNL